MSNAESISSRPTGDSEETAPALLGGAFLSDWVAEALIDRWIFTPLGKRVTQVLLPTRIRPNQVSFGSLLCGAIAGVCYGIATPHSFVLAGLFVAFSVVLDAADGELARARKQTSEMGKFFDNVADSVKTGSIIIGMIVGFLRLADWSVSSPAVVVGQVLLLCLGGAASLLVQVTGRNTWVSRYRFHAKGRHDRAYAKSEVVREELAAMRRKGGFWLERGIAGPLLWFVPNRPAPTLPRLPAPDRAFDEALLPYVRAWTFFGGATQLSAIAVSSMLASPREGLLFIALVMNAGYVALQVGSHMAHRRALAPHPAGAGSA